MQRSDRPCRGYETSLDRPVVPSPSFAGSVTTGLLLSCSPSGRLSLRFPRFGSHRAGLLVLYYI